MQGKYVKPQINNISGSFKVEVDINAPDSPVKPLLPQPTNIPPQIFRATTIRPYVTTTLSPVLSPIPSRSKFSISRSFHLDPTEQIGDSPFR